MATPISNKGPVAPAPAVPEAPKAPAAKGTSVAPSAPAPSAPSAPANGGLDIGGLIDSLTQTPDIFWPAPRSP